MKHRSGSNYKEKNDEVPLLVNYFHSNDTLLEHVAIQDCVSVLVFVFRMQS